MTPSWNLNVHYHDIILNAVPAHASNALDAGCGDGMLTLDLAKRGLAVTALDRDQPSIDRATANVAACSNVTLLEADLLQSALAPNSFDVVASIAMLHHIDAVQGIRAMRQLVAPGGVLAIVGFAQIQRPREYALAAAGSVRKRLALRRGDFWKHQAPMVWPPPLTFASMELLAHNELPGCTFRRLLSSRYALTWHAPR